MIRAALADERNGGEAHVLDGAVVPAGERASALMRIGIAAAVAASRASPASAAPT